MPGARVQGAARLTRRVNRFGPAKQFENGRSLRAALDRHDVQAAGGKGLADAALAGLADKNTRAVEFVESLQTAGQIHVVADDRVVHARGR